jgi:hypothetical protein
MAALTELEKFIARTQEHANRTGETFMVLNLNRHSPLYVMRGYSAAAENSDALVRVVKPLSSVTP